MIFLFLNPLQLFIKKAMIDFSQTILTLHIDTYILEVFQIKLHLNGEQVIALRLELD